MKIKTVLLFLLVTIIFSMLVSVSVFHMFKDKNVYVNLTEVYNGFSMKKTLEARLDATKRLKQNDLDSMNFIITQQEKYFAAHGEKDTRIRKLIDENRSVLNEKEREYTKSLEQISQTFQNQIWMQINTYVKEFGNTRGYDFIYGTDGQGTIMYASNKKDISKELTEYINNRYKGE